MLERAGQKAVCSRRLMEDLLESQATLQMGNPALENSNPKREVLASNSLDFAHLACPPLPRWGTWSATPRHVPPFRGGKILENRMQNLVQRHQEWRCSEAIGSGSGGSGGIEGLYLHRAGNKKRCSHDHSLGTNLKYVRTSNKERCSNELHLITTSTNNHVPQQY